MKRTALFVASTLALAGCGAAGTKLVSTWKDPQATKLDCSKTLVLFASKSATMRAVVEDRIVARVKNGVAARNVIDTSTSRNPNKLRERVQAEGYDCAIVVRFVGVESETQYTSGSVMSVPVGYRGFYNYYGIAWTGFYTPGDVSEKRTLVLDTNVYDVDADKLVWAARSRSVDFDQSEHVVDDLVDEASAAMRKEGLID
jgi:hypothetical protein